MRTLLRVADVPGPYILVGHSLGGLNVRYYAHQYPEEVAGLVLVDAAHEEQYVHDSIKETYDRIERAMPLIYGAQAFLTRVGATALFPNVIPSLKGMPESDEEVLKSLIALHPRIAAAASAETSEVRESHRQVREASIRTLGDLPLAVLSQGICDGCSTLSPEAAEEYAAYWQRLQREVAESSTRGTLTVATESGHNIMLEQPDLVVQAIHDVVQQAGG